MGLVDYSDSESDSDSRSETAPKPIISKSLNPPSSTTSSTTTGKKPFHKLVDRSDPGKIVVRLPTVDANASADSPSNDEPPPKRARTAGASASRFSNFGSFLPPPKKTTTILGTQPPATSSKLNGAGDNAPTSAVHLKTGSERAFARDSGDTNGESSSSGPSIPDGQKPEEDVKLVGKPLMFKPLSVARKPGQKKKNGNTKAGLPPSAAAGGNNTLVPEKVAEAAPPKKKVSLFSMGTTDDDTPLPTETTATTSNSTYKPLFDGIPESENPDADHDENNNSIITNQQSYQPPHQHQQQHTLSSIADDLSLSKADRRELFGRNPSSSTPSSTSNIINFNIEREYAHNEGLRASGMLADQVHNPVRSIAPGKHNLRQMVNMVQNNQAALEESFAAGRNNRRDAAGKYGWK